MSPAPTRCDREGSTHVGHRGVRNKTKSNRQASSQLRRRLAPQTNSFCRYRPKRLPPAATAPRAAEGPFVQRTPPQTEPTYHVEPETRGFHSSGMLNDIVLADGVAVIIFQFAEN